MNLYFPRSGPAILKLSLPNDCGLGRRPYLLTLDRFFYTFLLFYEKRERPASCKGAWAYPWLAGLSLSWIAHDSRLKSWHSTRILLAQLEGRLLKMNATCDLSELIC